MIRDDGPARDRLHRHWDAVVGGASGEDAPVDPALAEVVRRLHALGDVPGPDTGFARRLRRDLLDAPGTAPDRREALPPTMPLAAPPPARAERGRPAPFARHAGRHHGLRAVFAAAASGVAAAAVCAVFIGALVLVFQGRPDGRATPTPADLGAATPSSPPNSAGATGSATPSATATPRPAIRGWQPTGALVTARAAHTATLLRDGRVLVIGGMRFPINDQTGFLASAEIYDPATGRWSEVAPMSTPRWSHTATTLQDGRVLVVGGYRIGAESRALATAEIYDPATDRWTAVAPMGTGREGHTATLLHDGQVLIVGGTGGYGSQPDVATTAERYEPAANRWTPAGTLSAPRTGHTATLLPNGRVLVAGGSSNLLIQHAATELYDPRSNDWLPAASMTRPRSHHTATPLPDGQVLVAGGQIANDRSARSVTSLAETERYDPAADRWTAAGTMGTPRAGHRAAPLPGGAVLVTGGWDTPGSDRTTAERYDPTTGRWTAAGTMGDRAAHTATPLRDGRVLVAGGAAAAPDTRPVDTPSHEIPGPTSGRAGTAPDTRSVDTAEIYTDGPPARGIPAPSPCPAFQSAGLGLTREQWEARVGPPIAARSEGRPGGPGSQAPELVVASYRVPRGTYEAQFADGVLFGIRYRLDGGVALSLDEARRLIAPLLPADATLLGSSADGTAFRESYRSPSLVFQLGRLAGSRVEDCTLPAGLSQGVPIIVSYARQDGGLVSGTIEFGFLVGG